MILGTAADRAQAEELLCDLVNSGHVPTGMVLDQCSQCPCFVVLPAALAANPRVALLCEHCAGALGALWDDDLYVPSRRLWTP